MDSKGTTTVKAQKRSKDMCKIIHVTSVFQLFTMLLGYFCVQSEVSEVSDLIQNILKGSYDISKKNIK